ELEGARVVLLHRRRAVEVEVSEEGARLRRVGARLLVQIGGLLQVLLRALPRLVREADLRATPGLAPLTPRPREGERLVQIDGEAGPCEDHVREAHARDLGAEIAGVSIELRRRGRVLRAMVAGLVDRSDPRARLRDAEVARLQPELERAVGVGRDPFS